MVNPGRWRILAILFAVRSAMAFQFQSVAAVAPLLGRDLGVELADIGLLIGLYLAPGIALGLPGGAIGQRFGDKRTVLAGLVSGENEEHDGHEKHGADAVGRPDRRQGNERDRNPRRP